MPRSTWNVAAIASRDRAFACDLTSFPVQCFASTSLSDHRGMRRALSELQGGDPLVLVLSLGGFCPKDRSQHEGLLQHHREMQVGYCCLVTISTDNLIEAKSFALQSGAG
jgi:hypothetical protein